VFRDAGAFQQLLCSTSWQESKGLFVSANSAHSRVLCCNAGSHLKVNVDPLSAGDGHAYVLDINTGDMNLNWTTPDDEACDLCPLGEYSESLNVNKSCTSAARDQFVPAPGMNTATNCSDNSFTNPPNTSLCELCPAGKKMNRGTTATNCSKCDAGQFQDLSGKETCQDCPTGYYQDQIGMAYCVGCIPGQFQDQQGEQQCKNCLAGQHRLNTINGTNLTKCVNCPIGKAMLVPGAAKCVDCIPGQYQDQEGNKSCIKCASGRQFNVSIAVGISALNCAACGKGQHQEEEGSTFCLPCLTGTFQNVTGSSLCNDCPIGFSNGETEKESCTSCPKGTFQDAIQEANCKGMLSFSWNDGSVLELVRNLIIVVLLIRANSSLFSSFFPL